MACGDGGAVAAVAVTAVASAARLDDVVPDPLARDGVFEEEAVAQVGAAPGRLPLPVQEPALCKEPKGEGGGGLSKYKRQRKIAIIL